MNIEKALKFKTSIRPILNTVLVKDHFFYATDLETSITFKTHRPIPDGVYQREGIETLERVGGDVYDFERGQERGYCSHYNGRRRTFN